MLRYHSHPSLLSSPQSLEHPKLLPSTTRLSFLDTRPSVVVNPATRQTQRRSTSRCGTVRAAVAQEARPATAPSRPTTMYDLLSVSETAGFEEIKAAFKRQALRWHPDTCKSPDEKGYFAQRFMEAREAYLVLSDPVLREDYDYKLRTGRGVDSLDGLLFSRKGKGGARSQGFGDWEVQMETLRRRSAARERADAAADTWASRMRQANRERSCAAAV